MATHPLVVGGDHPPDDVNYGGEDTGPERYFIDHTYHFHHLEQRTSFAATTNRRTRSIQSMSSISVDSVDEAAWSSESTRRFMQEFNQNRLRTIGEQRPASLSSVDFDQLNGLTDISNKTGYISFAPALGAANGTASTSRPYSPHLRHGYPSTDSLMYSHSDRSGASTPLASPITTPVFDAATMLNLEHSLLAPPSLKKSNRIPPRWRSDPRITKPEHADKNKCDHNGTNVESPLPNIVSLDSDEEDDIEIKDKNIPMPPWDSSNANHHSANGIFRSTSSSTRSEDNPLLKLLTDHLMDISCTILDAMSCSRSFDSGEEEHKDVAAPSFVSL